MRFASVAKFSPLSKVKAEASTYFPKLVSFCNIKEQTRCLKRNRKQSKGQNNFEQLPTSSFIVERKVSPGQPSLPIKGTLEGVEIQDHPDHLKNQHNPLPGTSLPKSNLIVKKICIKITEKFKSNLKTNTTGYPGLLFRNQILKSNMILLGKLQKK